MNYIIITNPSQLINTANCVYDIQCDINLGNQALTIPANCILVFHGGSFINGTITGQFTRIEASPYQIFQNITLQGSWCVDYAYLEWFGAIGNGSADDRLAIQAAINSPFIHLKLLNRTYRIDSFCEMQTNWDSQPIIERVGIVISKPKILEGLNNGIDHSTRIVYNNSAYIDKGLFINSANVCIKNISFESETDTLKTWIYGTLTNIELSPWIPYLTLSDLYIKKCSKEAINIATYLCTINNVVIEQCQIGFFIHGLELPIPASNLTGTSTIISHCYVKYATTRAYDIRLMSYCLLNTCCADECGKDVLEGLVAHTDKPTADGYPYYLYGCTHLTMESCSCEQCYYSFYFDCCRGCNIISLTDWRNFNFDDYPFQELTTEIKRQIYVNNSIAIGFLRCIIGTLSSTPQISVKTFLIKNSKNIVFDNCLLRSANYSIGGTMTDVTVASENCEIISSTVNFIPNN